jgi:hypothetical protein
LSAAFQPDKENNVSDSKLDKRTVLDTFDDVTLFRFHHSVSEQDIISSLPRLRLMHLPLGGTRLCTEDTFSLSAYGLPWEVALYGAAIGETICAVFPYRDQARNLPAVWIIEPALFNDTAEAKVHAALARLAVKKDASIPFLPSGYEAPFLSAPDGEPLEPTFANLADAFFGAMTLHEGTTDAELAAACMKTNIALNISSLPQDKLDVLHTVRGSVTSTARVILLRNLEVAEHLVFPNAEIVLAPRLTNINGSLIARAATYIDMRALSAICGDVKLNSLAYADFENLGVARGDINLPAAKGIGFPILTRFTGKLTAPAAAAVNMPVLANTNRVPIGYVPPEPDKDDFVDAVLGRSSAQPVSANAA